MEQGTVIQASGKWCEVEVAGRMLLTCSIRGRFRIEGKRTTNPVAVGDEVLVERSEQKKGVVTKILPRKNYIIRKASNLSKAYHVIAANMDQCMVIISLSCPETPLAFLDRFLVTAEAYSVPAVIVVNKMDLYDRDLMEVAEYLRYLYETIGYKVFLTSEKDHKSIAPLAGILHDRVTLMTGNSGVGKSTLINILHPDLQIKTQEISELYRSGKHTTTFARMYQLPDGGRIIDTPGIKGFGVVDIEKAELYHFFPEIFSLSKKCRYHNCLHQQEPGCAVVDAVNCQDIALSRYRNYLQILHDQNEKHRQ